MLATTYNAGSMLCSDYGPLEWIGGHDSGVYRGRGNDGRYVALRFCAIDSDPARSALIELVYTASLVRHPMLTAVAGCQSYAGGALCLVSEYVPGQSLDRWIVDHGRPSLRMTTDFVHRLCLGLHAAHQRGLTHHALHPGNVMVLQPDTQPGARIVAKLLDLGVPAFVRPWPPRAAAMPYTAPELLDVTAPTAPAITPLTNVYSLGALLHYLVTGSAPERDADGQLMAANLRRSNPEIPALLERVIQRCLAVDPRLRPASAAELAAELGKVESEWRSSGVHRRESAAAAPGPSQVQATEDESQSVLHPCDSRPAADSFPEQPGRRESHRSLAAREPSGRVHAQISRPSTGSFPRLEIPASRRWAAGIVLGGLLALYFAALPSGAERSVAPKLATSPPTAPIATPAPDAHAVPAPVDDSLEPSEPIELPPTRTDDRVQVAEETLAQTPEPAVTAPRPRTRGKQAAGDSQPSAAGSVKRDAAPVIPPAPLPLPVYSVAPIQVQATQPQHVAVESETTEGTQRPSAGGPGEPLEVQVESVNVRGSLTVSVVRRAIERIRPMLTQCYKRHSKPGQAALPALHVSATIDEVGRVRSPSVEGGSLPALNDCVVKATSKMVSDAPDTGIVRASWRLSL